MRTGHRFDSLRKIRCFLDNDSPDVERRSGDGTFGNTEKEENTADILAYMETKRDVVNKIIDRYLIALLEEERIAKATPAQLTTALGTLIDKFTAQGRIRRTSKISRRLRSCSNDEITDNRMVPVFGQA